MTLWRPFLFDGNNWLTIGFRYVEFYVTVLSRHTYVITRTIHRIFVDKFLHFSARFRARFSLFCVVVFIPLQIKWQDNLTRLTLRRRVLYSLWIFMKFTSCWWAVSTKYQENVGTKYMYKFYVEHDCTQYLLKYKEVLAKR